MGELVAQQEVGSLLEQMRDPSADPGRRRDALLRLLTGRLGYDYADGAVPIEEGELAGLIAAPPRAVAETEAGFRILYIQLADASTRRGTERRVVDKLLRDHPYSLFVFSDADALSWTFLNARLARREDTGENRDTRSRRIYRRITVGPDDQLRTAIERIELLSLERANTSLFDQPAIDVQALHDEAFDVEKVTTQFYREYRRIFEGVEATVTGLHDDATRRLFTQRLFNRLMFLAFI